jgi:hypothetical protein
LARIAACNLVNVSACPKLLPMVVKPSMVTNSASLAL